jgi:UPF0176 protein
MDGEQNLQNCAFPKRHPEGTLPVVPAITNISCYQFAPLEDLKTLRDHLYSFCRDRNLKGTILIAPEGINLFIAGPRDLVDELVAEIRRIPGLASLAPKYSESDDQPFSRMLVRLKKEIIAFGVDGIDPSRYTSPRLPARTLKEWLDEGKPVVLYDTRNDYEVKLGTFKGAIPAGVNTFRDFPEAVAQLPEELKDAPIVTFCTGGIRCEKAAPFMESVGFRNVYQLEGGILKYFEEVGGDHYDGECFVFDQRVGVDPALRETDTAVCYACQAPLTKEEQEDTRYVANVSCPYCYKSDEEKIAEKLAERLGRLRSISHPLPGSAPYENHRPLRVTAGFEGCELIEMLSSIFKHSPREEWLSVLEQGRVIGPDGKPAGPEQIVKAGETYTRIFPGTIEPDVNPDIQVIFQDEALLVLTKPAPLPMHPCGRYNRNTLVYLMHTAWNPEHPRPAHRLDANTTGVVVCARTRHVAKLLQPQFITGDVKKIYLARVQGHPEQDQFRVDVPISAEASGLGAREIEEEQGLASITDFRVISRDADGTALLEVRPLTGRTNQIRIHLWHAGFPICGDPVYVAGQQKGLMQSLPVGAPPMCLHAYKISFMHPNSRKRVQFEAPVPEWVGNFSPEMCSKLD